MPSCSPTATAPRCGRCLRRRSAEADLVGPFEGDWDAFAAALATGNTYVNVHSEANPAGELRAQILPVWGAQLSADAETADVDSAAGPPVRSPCAPAPPGQAGCSMCPAARRCSPAGTYPPWRRGRGWPGRRRTLR
ncbi:MAG: CHRD domain-containing protein [Dehalococcoidia bacterium]|nr:CHRD domain-containing protein [Dehalococcoidia bacterium]